MLRVKEISAGSARTTVSVIALGLVASAAAASGPTSLLAQPPYLGVSCPDRPSVTGCGRVGIAGCSVRFDRRASRLRSSVVPVRLDAPPRSVKRRTYWQGFVHLDLARLGLPAQWFGTKPYKVLDLQLTIHRGTHTVRDVVRATLHPGWG